MGGDSFLEPPNGEEKLRKKNKKCTICHAPQKIERCLTCHPSGPLKPPLIAYASLKPFSISSSATFKELPSKLPYTT